MRLVKYKNAVYRAVAETMELQVLQLPSGQKFDPNFKDKCVGPWSTSLMNNKPLCSNGQQPLWTSSYDWWEQKTDWLRYCERNFKDAIGEQAVFFEVAPNARILRAYDYEDYDTIWELYPNTTQKAFSMGTQKLLDYNAIAAEYDGFHVTSDARSASELHDWDAESTVWFNTKVLTVKQVTSLNTYCSMAGHDQPVTPEEKRRLENEKLEADDQFVEKLQQHWESQKKDPKYKGEYPKNKAEKYKFFHQIPRPEL
jgi:hypothetical protein